MQVEGGEVQALQEDVVGAEALQGGAPEDGGVGLDDTVFNLKDLLFSCLCPPASWK